MDNEIKGVGNSYAFSNRMYDSRIARFFKVDPLTQSYPMLSSYQFAHNSPVQAIDLEGLQGYKMVDHQFKTTTMVVTYIIYPKTKNNPNGMSRDHAKIAIEGIYDQFAKRNFDDPNHTYTMDGMEFNYELNLVINLVEAPTKRHAMAMLGKSVNKNKVYNDKIILEHKPETVDMDPYTGKAHVTRGGAKRGWNNISDSYNSYTNTHELWHSLTHRHPNAEKELKNLINTNVGHQGPGHRKAGGIFDGEDLSRRNVDDALNTLPEVELDEDVDIGGDLILGTEGYD